METPKIARDPQNELRRLGGLAEDAIDLAEAALLLADLERPGGDLGRYRHHLSLLTRDTAAAADGLDAEDSLEARAAALRRVLVERYGYEGDAATYDDLQNANLMRVIDRRRGLPVALGILFLHAARAQGWQAAALNFPGHFLIRLELHGERLILDPFHQGRICETRDLRDLLKFALGPEVELGPGGRGRGSGARRGARAGSGNGPGSSGPPPASPGLWRRAGRGSRGRPAARGGGR